MKRAIPLLMALALMAACGNDSDGAGASDLPVYDTSITEPDQIIVTTDATDPDQLRAIFDEVRAQHQDEGDAWYVSLNCASVPSTDSFDPRLANGRFANTDLGQAQTGLESTDDFKFDATGLTDCEPPTPADEEAIDEALADAGIPPEPDQATADAYIDALDAINPAIDRDDPESAIDRGRNQCSTIKGTPDDRAHQVEMTNMRFTSPDAPEGWGTETAEQILDVVHQYLCPSY